MVTGTGTKQDMTINCALVDCCPGLFKNCSNEDWHEYIHSCVYVFVHIIYIIIYKRVRVIYFSKIDPNWHTVMPIQFHSCPSHPILLIIIIMSYVLQSIHTHAIQPSIPSIPHQMTPRSHPKSPYAKVLQVPRDGHEGYTHQTSSLRSMEHVRVEALGFWVA